MFRAALQRTAQVLGRLFPRADSQSPRLHFVGDAPGSAWGQAHHSRLLQPASVIVESPMNPFALLHQKAQIEQDEAALRGFRMRQNLRTLQRLEAEAGFPRTAEPHGQYRPVFAGSLAPRGARRAIRRGFGG